MSYVRESSPNKIGATKSFVSWYVPVGKLVNRTAFFSFESVTPLATANTFYYIYACAFSYYIW